MSAVLTVEGVTLEELILSRKISLRSFTRHFAKWKERKFTLESGQALLTVRSSNSHFSIDLSSPTVHIGRHDYAGDGFHWLWIKYFDKADKSPKEIALRFELRDHMLNWEQELTAILAARSLEVQIESTELLRALVDFVREEVSVQSILVQSTEQDAYGTYYNSSENNRSEDGSYGEDCLAGSALSDDDGDDERPPAVAQIDDAPQQAVPVGSQVLAAIKAVEEFQAIKVKVPSLNILLMAVGTRGDVHPFLELGLILRSHGHRVRLATHEIFRSFVCEHGLEYYPIAGDPVALSEFMVKTQGFILPTTPETIREAPKYHSMMVDILHTCWDACLLTDPLSPDSKAFSPDAIISNPVTYAHIHCAEALGVPLHLMFPQPWIPTKAFPHPLSCLSYSQGWCAENFLSYQVVDRLMWLSLESEINSLRVNKLGLEPIRVGQGGWNLLNHHQVPFVKMWSPGLVPKPKDWPSHVDVVGTFFPPSPYVDSSSRVATELRSTGVKPIFSPAADLQRFLANKETPVVYVGFGSMVLDDLEGVLSLFLKAAALLGVRIIVQMGWSSISAQRFLQIATEAQSHAEIIRTTEEMNISADNIFPTVDEARLRVRMPSNDVVPVPPPVASQSVETVKSFGGWLMGALGVKSESTKQPQGAPDWDWAEVELDPINRTSPSLSSDKPDTSVRRPRWSATRDAFFMGPCPHEWLFQQVHAVVHHGGAGTTAMGLRFGCPTWICPFFGDQFFWGERIHSLGLGGKPCPVQQLTVEGAQQTLELMLFDECVRRRCYDTGQMMRNEDGLDGAVQAFYRHLPLQHMICDVSVMHGRRNDAGELEVDLAQVFCFECGLKMSLQTFRALHGDSTLHIQHHRYRPCVYADLSLREASDPTDGLVQGVGGLMHEMIGGLSDAAADPVKGLYSQGLQGGVAGMVSGLTSLLSRPMVGSGILLHRLEEGLRAHRECMKAMNKSVSLLAADDWDQEQDQDDGLMVRSVLLANKDSNNTYAAVQQGALARKSKTIRHSAALSVLTSDLRTQRMLLRVEAAEATDDAGGGEMELPLPLSPLSPVSSLSPAMSVQSLADISQGSQSEPLDAADEVSEESVGEEETAGGYSADAAAPVPFVQAVPSPSVFASTGSQMNMAAIISSAGKVAADGELLWGTSPPGSPLPFCLELEDGPPCVPSPAATSAPVPAAAVIPAAILPTPAGGPANPTGPVAVIPGCVTEDDEEESYATLRAAFSRTLQCAAMFRRLGGKRRRYMSEARFVHLLLRVIARDQLHARLFRPVAVRDCAVDSAPPVDEERQMAAVLALFQRLTRRQYAQAAPAPAPGSLHALVQSQGRGLDLADFLLLCLHLAPPEGCVHHR